MIRFVAFFLAAFAAVYAEPGSQDFWRGYALPGMFVLCLVYVFWWQGFVVLALGALSWHFMDTAGGSWLTAGLLPMGFGACVVYFCWWIVVSARAGPVPAGAPLEVETKTDER